VPTQASPASRPSVSGVQWHSLAHDVLERPTPGVAGRSSDDCIVVTPA
jgi:hypothetical protein